MLDDVAAARAAAWAAVGEVDPYVTAHLVNPAFMGGPQWPGFRQSFLHVRLPDGRRLAASDGLSDPYEDEPDGTGIGAELYTVHDDLPEDVAEATRSWAFQVLYEAAQNIANRGPVLVPGLERYGTLSMSVPGADAPDGWGGDEVAFLFGVPVPGVPATVELPTGTIRLVSVVPIRTDELAAIMEGGAAARAAISAKLSALDGGALASRDRPSVVG